VPRYAGEATRRLLERLGPVLVGDPPCGPDQLVHGDLAGNVLFGDDEDGPAPGVLDLSPYRRPGAYADAIVVVDAVAWHGADLHHARRFVERAPDGRALLARAITFRAVAERGSPRAYADLVDILIPAGAGS
jgi:hypothetical protein